MSSPTALATVTATLQHLLSDIATSVTTQPPGTARSGSGDQINIFLYGTYHNTAFSNAPMPGSVREGETAFPPLALILKYLITAYGANDDDISGQQLMGQTMSRLHNHPILGRTDIEGIAPDSNLQHQVDKIRITPDMINLDDMSKLWTSFQSADYRLSTGYEVSVVLIESTIPDRTPLPVLTRGETDRGVEVVPSLTPPYPVICELEYANGNTTVLLGETFTLRGYNLSGDTVTARFSHPDLPLPIELPAQPGNTNLEVAVQIPNNPANWMTGFYTVEILISIAGEQDRVTNILPLAIGPSVLGIAPANPVVRNVDGDATITLTVSPQIRTSQIVSMLLGDGEVVSEAHPFQTSTLDFVIREATVGSHHIRLRVDGVDSRLIDQSVRPPIFDPAMEVVIS